jgi:hypothetical protein
MFSLDSASVHSLDKATDRTVVPIKQGVPTGRRQPGCIIEISKEANLLVYLPLLQPSLTPLPLCVSLSIVSASGYRWLIFSMTVISSIHSKEVRGCSSMVSPSILSLFGTQSSEPPPLHFSAGQKFVHYGPTVCVIPSPPFMYIKVNLSLLV